MTQKVWEGKQTNAMAIVVDRRQVKISPPEIVSRGISQCRVTRGTCHDQQRRERHQQTGWQPLPPFAGGDLVCDRALNPRIDWVSFLSRIWFLLLKRLAKGCLPSVVPLQTTTPHCFFFCVTALEISLRSHCAPKVHPSLRQFRLSAVDRTFSWMEFWTLWMGKLELGKKNLPWCFVLMCCGEWWCYFNFEHHCKTNI